MAIVIFPWIVISRPHPTNSVVVIFGFWGPLGDPGGDGTTEREPAISSFALTPSSGLGLGVWRQRTEQGWWVVLRTVRVDWV